MWLELCGTVAHGDRDEAKYSTEHDDVEVSLIFGTKFSGGPSWNITYIRGSVHKVERRERWRVWFHLLTWPKSWYFVSSIYSQCLFSYGGPATIEGQTICFSNFIYKSSLWLRWTWSDLESVSMDTMSFGGPHPLSPFVPLLFHILVCFFSEKKNDLGKDTWVISVYVWERNQNGNYGCC